MFVKSKDKRPKKVTLDANDELFSLQVKVSKKDHNELREEAFRKNVSQSSIMRRVLKDHLKDEELRRKELGEALEIILDKCVGWFGGFEIDGEDGFVERMYRASKYGLTLESLSDEQWNRVKQHLLVGHSGYGKRLLNDAPSPHKFVGKFLKIKPSKKQIAWLESLSDKVEDAFEEEDLKVKEELKEEALKNRIEKNVGVIDLEEEGAEEQDSEEEEDEKIEVELVDE